MSKGSRMSEDSQLPLFPTSSAEDSPARTSLQRERARALLESAADSGLSLPGLLALPGPSGSSWRTYREAQAAGLTRSWPGWKTSAMKRFRSHCQRRLLALLTSEGGSSLLPTPNATPYGTGQNGDPGDGRGEYSQKGKPSLWTMARQDLLPTPVVSRFYGGSQVRKKKNESLYGMAAKGLLPTPVANDAKKGSRANPGVSLTDVVVHKQALDIHRDRRPNAGHLSPRFVEWMMGFPQNWTEPSSDS